MIKTKRVINNQSRGKTFGVVINPKLIKGQSMEWLGLTEDEIIDKLRELNFPRRLDVTEMLNQLEIDNLSGNKCKIEEKIQDS